jgi:hypothetical protein
MAASEENYCWFLGKSQKKSHLAKSGNTAGQADCAEVTVQQ